MNERVGEARSIAPSEDVCGSLGGMGGGVATGAAASD